MKSSKIMGVPVILISFLIFSFYAKQPSSTAEDQIIQNLRAFAKLYGYVRFFHPSDEANQMDWNKFAIYGTEQVMQVKNSKELKEALKELFLPVAPTVYIYNENEKPEDPFQNLKKDAEGLKHVAWQHKGVWLGYANTPYRSIRLNRETEFPVRGRGIGALIQEKEATKLQEKEVKIIAHAKTNLRGLSDQALLLLQFWREGQLLSAKVKVFPTKSKEWKKYEVKEKVRKDAQIISFGLRLLLRGAGQAWVDDFQLFVRNKNNEWTPIEIENPGFEEGEVNKKPNSWKCQSPGFVFQVKDENPYKEKNCLLMERENVKFSGKLFEKHPEIGEMINKKIGMNLFCQIPLVLYSDEQMTLGKKDNCPFHKLESDLGAIDVDNLTANNEFVRIADVIIAWNVFQHFYPYFDVVTVDWDEQLTDSLEEALVDQDEKEFHLTLRKLVAKLQDGHGGVYHNRLMKRAGFPFKVDWIEGKVVVTHSEDTKNFQKGDIVLSIDGMKAEKVLLNEEEYISGSPQWKRLKSLRSFGYGEEGQTATLNIKRGKETFEIEVTRSHRRPVLKPGQPNIEKLEGNIFYVNLDKGTMKEINEKIDELAQAKGVIFDLRGYPNANHGIICHLLKEKDTSRWIKIPQIIYPDQENLAGFDELGWMMEPKQPQIKGKVVFITDGRAISSAESFMGYIEHHKLAEIVGQPTAGANGNVNELSLPGGFRVTFTGMRVTKHDGSQHHLVGIKPTVSMKKTLKGVVEGRDEFLEKAIDIINQ